MSQETITVQKQRVDKNGKDWKVFEFFAPIEEKLLEDDKFVIKGVAINETTTLNNVKYVAEELEKAASSFRNVPVLLDHRNEVKNIVGRTTERVAFNHSMKRIDYEAEIMDKTIIEMIKDGRIRSVSIGAKVDDLTEEEDGSMKAMGIKGLELSLVAVPGDNQAGLAQALQQSFHLKEMAMQNVENVDKNLNKNGGLIMAEDTKVETETETEAPAEEVVEEPVAEEATEAVTNVNVKVDNSEMVEMRKQISELKELLTVKVKEDVEEPAVEVPAEAPVEDETKGEVGEETAEEAANSDNVIVERAKTGYSMYRDYTTEDVDTKLKRLIR